MDEKKLIEQKIFNDTSSYRDIMNIPYHQSKRHLPMNQLDRAFQFAPFGALEGFNDLIKEKTDLYSRKKFTTGADDKIIILQLKYLQKHPLKVDVNYFNDNSGYYEHLKGFLQTIDWKKGRANFDEVSVVILNIRSIKLLNESNF
ncbi:hypothetical protein ACFQAV_11005 [Companilactobacillus huachuanensis]|uniref:Uncharacterized protein n=1 Tax=Companilactobacillus huachuanensis TaxID=2559914 RepID=A0ABW1RPG6_9LACO|nr:hypothetical protein [Companilactobacillus huachuanensis]